MTVRALAEMVAWLDAYLDVARVPDSTNALNGLQVQNRSGRIGRIAAAVDASLETIADVGRRDGAAEGGVLLLVHHGLFWDGNVPLTDRRFRRVTALLDNDIALYGAHIPLDLHPEVGNNAVLARALGVTLEGTFAEHRGVQIGVHGTLELSRESLTARLDEQLRTKTHMIPGGPRQVRRVGIVTGAGSSALPEARALGLDTLITGEGPHHAYFDAMEWGMNLALAGHYATEQVGVQALADKLARQFGLPWAFHWHPTGL